MKKVLTQLSDVFVLELDVYRDERGEFVEVWSEATMAALGLPVQWSQDNLLVTHPGIFRGLHFQCPPQAKLIWCAHGAVADVVVDLRSDSPTYRQGISVCLSAHNHNVLYVPVGCAHGFQAISNDDATACYKASVPYSGKTLQCGIRWDDPALELPPWHIAPPVVNDRDASWPLLTS